MRLSFIKLILCCYHILQLTHTDDFTLKRHIDGDIFTIQGSCHKGCKVFSRNTANPHESHLCTFKSNDSCNCQCNYDKPVFRDDLRICVNQIDECNVGGFLKGSGLVEKVPYVFLPQYGQILYPDAEIKFQEIKLPVCVITGVQQLGQVGWLELRNLSFPEFPLSIYRDEGRIFLQWTGESKLRDDTEGRLVIVKFACRDSYHAASHQKVFTPCVAFRIAGSPSRNSIEEIFTTTSSPSGSKEGLRNEEYVVIGVSSTLLALVYFSSVLLYLRHSRYKSAKHDEESGSEAQLQARSSHCFIGNSPPAGLKCNPLLTVSNRGAGYFDSENCSSNAINEHDFICQSKLDKNYQLLLVQSENKSNDRDNITSALIHPYDRNLTEPTRQNFNLAAVIQEKLPEEDVRVVETTDNNSNCMPIFPGTQRRKLYFNPAYFEKQLLIAPPQAAVDFLLNIREVISIAKHKIATNRFTPTLKEIPEESEIISPQEIRKQAISMKNLHQQMSPKTSKCTGCPGCGHNGTATPKVTIQLASEILNGDIVDGVIGDFDAASVPMSGESRVRAWLDNVKLLEARWTNPDQDELQNAAKSKRLLDHSTNKNVKKNNSRVSEKNYEEYIRLRKTPDRPAKFATEESETFENRNIVKNEEINKINAASAVGTNADLLQITKGSFKKFIENLKTSSEKLEDANLTAAAVIVAKVNNEAKFSTASYKKIKGIKKTHRLLNILNNKLFIKSTSDVRCIMDTIIKEIISKEMEKKSLEYEMDSLEKTKVTKKSSSSLQLTDKSSSAQSIALPVNEKLTTRNAIIDVQISTPISTIRVIKNENLPKVISLEHPRNHALVSEVYVNDRYASPSESDDDSWPEVQYEPTTPGHLTIKVLDSPTNYIKQVESEYEADTLERKPMKFKINENPTNNKDIVNEVFVDSLERPPNILLRSKSYFSKENEKDLKSQHEYSSLREIYEARIKFQQQLPQFQELKNMNLKKNCHHYCDEKLKKSSQLKLRHERPQSNAKNQLDVVPKPSLAFILEHCDHQKMHQNYNQIQLGRSFTKTGDLTICEDAFVVKQPTIAVGKSSSNIIQNTNFNNYYKNDRLKSVVSNDLVNAKSVNEENKEINKSQQQHTSNFSKYFEQKQVFDQASKMQAKIVKSTTSCNKVNCFKARVIESHYFENNEYVNIPETDTSWKWIFKHQESQRQNSCTCTESDESEELEEGANSESGAESIETDSVFLVISTQNSK